MVPLYSPAEIQKQLEWRYATKQFDCDKKISDDKWEVLENCLALSPSSYGLQPWKFVVVKNPAIREKLKAHAWNQGQVTDASHFVVLTTLKGIDRAFAGKYLDRITKVRGVKRETLKGLENMLVANVVEGKPDQREWAQRQAYIAMGFLLETAALLGVDSCPMEGFDPEAFDEILGLKDSPFASVAAVALGYRAESDVTQFWPKVRFPKEEVVQYA